MQYERVYIPYGAYWCTPFCKWQGCLSNQAPIPFAANVTASALKQRGIPLEVFDGLCLGTTVPSRHSFYGAPWLAGLAGMGRITGPTISQACATSARCLAYGAEEISCGAAETFLAIAADRTSNGPHIYYPAPTRPGGSGTAEDWVLDNFQRDPFAANSMIETAENVARAAGIGRREQEETALLRHRQYERALADDAEFHRRYIVPVTIKDGRGRKQRCVERDEGVFPMTAEGLARLSPIVEGGTVTFGCQTHPADGNAAVVLASRERARELSRGSGIEIALLSSAQARVERGMMPKANVPAARLALKRAGIDAAALEALTTHLPFAVGDIYLARELGVGLDRINRFGCSLIWGHPQAPTGLRSVIELIEDLASVGGGYGLFSGCAAGDSAMALVLRVSVD